MFEWRRKAIEEMQSDIDRMLVLKAKHRIRAKRNRHTRTFDLHAVHFYESLIAGHTEALERIKHAER